MVENLSVIQCVSSLNSQALQALCGAPLLPRAHLGALVLLGRVLGRGILCPGPPEIHSDPECHLAGQQCCAHVGEQALRQDHQPKGEPTGRS